MNSVVADREVGPAVANAPGAPVADDIASLPLRLPSRRVLIICAAVLIIVTALATFGHHWWTVGRFTESTDDAYVGGDITVIAPKVSGHRFSG